MVIMVLRPGTVMVTLCEWIPARKQVDKINAELDERDARWSEMGDARWPGPHWPDGPP